MMMTAIYIAGVISGVVLVVIALVGWIHKSALIIEEKRGQAGSHASKTAMADNREERYSRRCRSLAHPS